MHKRLRTVARVLAAGVTLGLLMSEMIGCFEVDEIDIPDIPEADSSAFLLDIDPPDGGEIRVDGRLVLDFSDDPGIVTVSSSPATVVGNTATWTATGLTAGEQATLTIEWDGDSETITLTVIESTCAPSGEGCVDLVSTDPPDGGDLPVNELLVISFSGDPGPVTVNGDFARGSGSSEARWFPAGLTPGDQAVLGIVWDDGSTAITVTVLEQSCAGLLDSCENDEDCCSERPCVFGTCGSIFCAERGDACGDDGDCCDDLPCVNGTCGESQPCGEFDDPCETDEDCCDGLPCVNGGCI